MATNEYGGESRRVIAYLGLLVFGIGVITLTPLFVIFLRPLTWRDASNFLIAGITYMLIGGGLWYILRGGTDHYLSAREAAVIMSSGWLVATILGGLPFVLGNQLSWLDAFYESISGWTGTGLTMFTQVELVPPIYLLWRSIMEYLGSAGFAVLMLSAVIGPEAIGLYRAEGRSDHLLPSVLDTARLFMGMYGLYLVIGTALYWIVGLNLFDAVNHAMAALSAGGFSTYTSSIGYFNSAAVEYVSMGLMLLGSSNFTIHYLLVRKRGFRALRDREVYALIVVLALGIPLVYWGIRPIYGVTSGGVRAAVFQAVSASTTTGFGTADVSKWGDLPLAVLTLLMIAGGGTGGTGGGIKLSRLATLWQAAVWAVRKRLYYERVVLRHAMYRQGELESVQQEEILDVAAVVFLYMVTFLVGTAVFMLHGVPLAVAGFEFASSLSTVGLSAGVTGPNMPAILKITQMAGMWLGRLEFVAVFAALGRLVPWR